MTIEIKSGRRGFHKVDNSRTKWGYWQAARLSANAPNPFFGVTLILIIKMVYNYVMEVAVGIYSMRQSQGGNVHAFLLDDENESTLIDTLYDTDAHRILAHLHARLERLYVEPQSAPGDPPSPG
jgi:hypothetical protein